MVCSLLISGSASVLYSFVLTIETFIAPGDSITPVMASIMNYLLVSIYICSFVIGITIVLYSVHIYRKHRRPEWLEHVLIISFSTLFVAFGMYVSYSDFWEEKQILCFVMMMIFAGYLTIYRPYISGILLISSFMGFYNILLTYKD